MKVEYIEPFVQAATNVLQEVSGGGAKPGILGLLGTTFSTGSVNITTRVNGTLEGDVVYSMSSLTARKLAGLITGIETHSFGRSMGSGLSQLGEHLAMQTSRLLTERGYSCEVSRPTVFQGLNVEFSSFTPALMVPIETTAGQVEVSVAVHDDQQS